MSTLDDLKKQASDATMRNQVAGSSKVSDDEQWRKLEPVMKFLKDHFTELASTLNVLGKGILVDFQLNDAVSMKRLKGQNYKITHPVADKERDFIFEFENVGDNPSYALLPSGPGAAAFKNTLSENQIQCTSTSVDKNKSIKFEIKALVRTKYRFTADLVKENISLTINNYNNIWSQTNYFKKTEITTVLMDELTRHIMREPNKYNEMVGNVISEEMRTELRKKLKAEQTAQNTGTGESQTKPAKKKKKKKVAKEKTLFGKLFKKK